MFLSFLPFFPRSYHHCAMSSSSVSSICGEESCSLSPTFAPKVAARPKSAPWKPKSFAKTRKSEGGLSKAGAKGKKMHKVEEVCDWPSLIAQLMSYSDSILSRSISLGVLSSKLSAIQSLICQSSPDIISQLGPSQAREIASALSSLACLVIAVDVDVGGSFGPRKLNDASSAGVRFRRQKAYPATGDEISLHGSSDDKDWRVQGKYFRRQEGEQAIVSRIRLSALYSLGTMVTLHPGTLFNRGTWEHLLYTANSGRGLLGLIEDFSVRRDVRGLALTVGCNLVLLAPKFKFWACQPATHDDLSELLQSTIKNLIRLTVLSLQAHSDLNAAVSALFLLSSKIPWARFPSSREHIPFLEDACINLAAREFLVEESAPVQLGKVYASLNILISAGLSYSGKSAPDIKLLRQFLKVCEETLACSWIFGAENSVPAGKAAGGIFIVLEKLFPAFSVIESSGAEGKCSAECPSIRDRTRLIIMSTLTDTRQVSPLLRARAARSALEWGRLLGPDSLLLKACYTGIQLCKDSKVNGLLAIGMLWGRKSFKPELKRIAEEAALDGLRSVDDIHVSVAAITCACLLIAHTSKNGGVFERTLFPELMRVAAKVTEQPEPIQRAVAEAVKVLLLPIAFMEGKEDLKAKVGLWEHLRDSTFWKKVPVGIRWPASALIRIFDPELPPSAHVCNIQALYKQAVNAAVICLGCKDLRAVRSAAEALTVAGGTEGKEKAAALLEGQTLPADVTVLLEGLVAQ